MSHRCSSQEEREKTMKIIEKIAKKNINVIIDIIDETDALEQREIFKIIIDQMINNNFKPSEEPSEELSEEPSEENFGKYGARLHAERRKKTIMKNRRNTVKHKKGGYIPYKIKNSFNENDEASYNFAYTDDEIDNNVGNNIIIDLEFNGLYRYDFIPEITQVKMKNLTNGKTICKNFQTKNSGFAREFYKTPKGEIFFTSKEFYMMLNEIKASYDDNFYGFSIETDKKVLSQYGIYLKNYSDISWELRLTKEYEKELAYAGSSLECCYYLATKKVVEKDHSDEGELSLIEMLYYEAFYNTKKIDHLTIYPWGEMAGMPLKEYCIDYRRKADGYRFNNNNALASALDYYCEE